MELAQRLLVAPGLAAARRLLDRATPGELEAALEPLAGEVLRRLRDDPQRALAAAERTALLAEASGDARHRARATWVRGHALAGALRNQDALACYEQAERDYRGLGDRLSAARTAIGQVNALMYLGRYQPALAVGERARTALMRLGQPAPAARLDMNLGNIHQRLEQHGAALALYDRALRVARRLRDAGMARIIQYNRANILIALGRLEHAERIARLAQEAARAAGERWVVASGDYNLGYIHLLQGDYARAFGEMDAARAAYEELGHAQAQVVVLLDLTELLLEMNSFTRARAMGRRARAMAEQLRMQYEAGRATLFLGVAAQGHGEDAEAESLLGEASAIFEAAGHQVSGALCALYRAETERRRGATAAARRRLQRAARTFAAAGVPLHEAAALVRLAAACLAPATDLPAARAALGRAGRLLRRVHSPWLSAQLDHLRGRLALASGDPGRALRHYQQAVARIESVRGRIGIDEFRVSFAENKAPIYADLIELLLARGGRRAVGDAFAMVERSRSRALVDLLAGRLSGAAAAAEPRTAALLRRIDKLRAEVNWLAGFDPEGGGGRRDERRLALLTPRIRRREAEIADLMLRLEHRSTALGALASGETVGLAEVQRGLAPQTTLVEYFISRHSARAFVIDRQRARIVDLPVGRHEIEDLVARLRFQIEKWGYGDAYARSRAGVLRQAVRSHLRLLAERLWDPLGEVTERVVVVPHGALHSVPFHALELAGGGQVLDHHRLTYLPSASAQRYLRDGGGTGASRGATSGVLVVGVADDGIPQVEREVEQVRGVFDRGRVLSGEQASRARFREAAVDADVIHVATHGMFREDDPHFSALRLADGWLSLYDIFGLRVRASLVALSACQSGRSWVGAGDELVGLVRGFLHAGAAALLVSLWPVQDDSTAELMTGFYRRLQAGEARDAALRAAMLELREVYPHPYHWAPFVMIGHTQPGPAPARR